MPRFPAWTPERVTLLTALWPEDLSASAIASQLGGGLSRNAVIGKAHRLGLPGRPRRQRLQKPGQSRPPETQRIRLRPVAPTEPPPIDGLTSLLAARRGDCRWPCGDPLSEAFRFCGRPVSRGAYCASHAALAYRGSGKLPAEALLKLSEGG